jgi:hypothetical protein
MAKNPAGKAQFYRCRAITGLAAEQRGRRTDAKPAASRYCCVAKAPGLKNRKAEASVL